MLIHDAARPFVSEGMIDRVIAGLGRAIAVGDSPRGDVAVPHKRGYRAYHLERK